MTAPAPDLAALERLLAESTPGPWSVDPDDREDMDWNNHVLAADGGRICFMAHGGPARQTEFDANAALIAAARTALPALLEERREMRALAERLAKHIERVRDERCLQCQRGTPLNADGDMHLVGAYVLGKFPVRCHAMAERAALADARSAGLIETAKEDADG